jgi:hypothetical protein
MPFHYLPSFQQLEENTQKKIKAVYDSHAEKKTDMSNKRRAEIAYLESVFRYLKNSELSEQEKIEYGTAAWLYFKDEIIKSEYSGWSLGALTYYYQKSKLSDITDVIGETPENELDIVSQTKLKLNLKNLIRKNDFIAQANAYEEQLRKESFSVSAIRREDNTFLAVNEELNRIQQLNLHQQFKQKAILADLDQMIDATKLTEAQKAEAVTFDMRREFQNNPYSMLKHVTPPEKSLKTVLDEEKNAVKMHNHNVTAAPTLAAIKKREENPLADLKKVRTNDRSAPQLFAYKQTLDAIEKRKAEPMSNLKRVDTRVTNEIVDEEIQVKRFRK